MSENNKNKFKLPNHLSLKFFLKQMHQEIYFQQLRLTIVKHFHINDYNADVISIHEMY